MPPEIFRCSRISTKEKPIFHYQKIISYKSTEYSNTRHLFHTQSIEKPDSNLKVIVFSFMDIFITCAFLYGVTSILRKHLRAMKIQHMTNQCVKI